MGGKRLGGRKDIFYLDREGEIRGKGGLFDQLSCTNWQNLLALV